MQLTVLHDVADNAELVEVAASPLGAEWLLEGDLLLLVRAHEDL
jgi:hypothetical protein